MPLNVFQNLAEFPLSGEHDNDLPADLGKPTDFTWRDYLLMLLRIDAGIEQALMVQYLYAAYSLGGEQVPYDKRRMVRRWQQTLLSIAKEEMGHLITVQNVITCLGGAVCLDREDYPWDHAFYPFPFELEPLTLESLSKYVYTEAPIGWRENHHLDTKAAPSAKAKAAAVDETVPVDENDPHWQEIRRHIQSRLAAAQKGPQAADSEVKSVAVLFKVILAILKDPKRISDADFFPDTFAQQAHWDAWACNHGQVSGEDAPDHLQEPGNQPPEPRTCPTTADVLVVPVATRDDVINALEQVAEQGEAAHSNEEPSHFMRFLRIYKEFSANFPKRDAIKPARDLPINPTTFRDLRRDNGDAFARSTYIENPVSQQWAKLFNLRYRLLLAYLAQTFRLARALNPNKGPGSYQAVTHHAFCEMYNLKAISEILIRRPLDGPDKPFRPAGPPFQMPYTLELPESSISCWMQYLDILNASEDVREAIRQHPDARLRDQERDYLDAMANADRESKRWIGTVLEASRVTAATEQ